MKATCLKNIFKGGVNYPPGSNIEISDPQEASRLIALKAIDPIQETEPEKTEPEKPKAKKK